MNLILLGWVLGIVTFMIGYFIGWTAAKGTFQERVTKIFKARKEIEDSTGPVKQLNPEELAKKRTREIFDRYL